jgi:DNA-binding response OmpR family regulator
MEMVTDVNEPPRRRTILVVDDEEGIRTVLRLALTRAGYEVVEAEDGEVALERIAEEVPDLVMLDVMMPGMGGYAVCQTLREQPQTAALPVIMLSARTDSRSRQAGLSAGATKYLTKPLAADQLLRHVAEALQTVVS